MEMSAKMLLALLPMLAPALPAADPTPEALVESHHFKRARAVLQPRVRANPNDAQAAYLLSKVKQAYHDLDGALQLAEKAVAMNPKSATYHVQLAYVIGDIAVKGSKLAQFGHARRYRKEAETALSLDPMNLEAKEAMLSYYLEAPGIMGGDRHKAEALAEEILRLNPARGYLDQIRFVDKDHAKLKEQDFLARLESLYQKAVAADPKNVEAHVRLSNVYLAPALKKYDLAEQQAREVLKLDPGRTSGYSLLASAYSAQERWTDLDAILEQAEKAVPDDLAPYFHAGRALVSAGKDMPRAERCLRKYMGQEPEPSSPPLSRANYQLGLALEKQGRKAEAITALETVLRLEPDFEPAKKELKRLKG